MKNKEKFLTEMAEGYTFEGETIELGGAMFGEEVQTGTIVRAPLSTMNRHGLIAGATGTGKSKTLQVLAEQLSLKGVPVMLMDVKGDLSGLAKASPGHPKIDERMTAIGLDFKAEGMPVELLTISEDQGTRMRATVSEFGPVLVAKMLNATPTQSSIISVLFKYADDIKLPLLDLKDFKRLLQYAMGNGKLSLEAEYGRMHPSSVTAILRKAVELEEQGGDLFFGEPSFEIEDLTRIDKKGRGYLSVLRVTDIQDKPKLFSTFMLSLLAEIYNKFPEEGDIDKPKLVMFIDEAHLVFNEASDELLSQIENVIKLIRSKGVGVYFVTQNPADVPDSVLSQLGMKIQHALRAFTAKDRKAIKLTSENYPLSDFYDTAEVLTNLGTGEALISVLDEKGRPSPLVRSMMRAPVSRMDVLTENELKDQLKASKIFHEYEVTIDRKSAYEILEKKLEVAEEETTKKKTKSKRSSKKKEKDNIVEQLSKNTMVRQLGREATRQIVRGVLGSLGIKTSRRKSGWF